MDLADIKRQAEAAREFEHPFGAFTFQLRLPTPFEAECAAAGQGFTRRATGDVVVRAQRALTEVAIIGWRGLTVRDILGEHKHGDDEFAYEPDAVPLLLDERSDIAQELWLKALLPKLEARNQAKEATAKNSQRASPGARVRPMRENSQPAAA